MKLSQKRFRLDIRKKFSPRRWLNIEQSLQGSLSTSLTELKMCLGNTLRHMCLVVSVQGQELNSMILMGLFQLSIFYDCDSMSNDWQKVLQYPLSSLLCLLVLFEIVCIQLHSSSLSFVLLPSKSPQYARKPVQYKNYSTEREVREKKSIFFLFSGYLRQYSSLCVPYMVFITPLLKFFFPFLLLWQQN